VTTIPDAIEKVANEFLAIVVVVVTMAVIGFQSIRGIELTMPLEPMMLVLMFYFTKQLTSK
jgi:hypothetical protein